MSELPFYCDIAAEARSVLWLFWWIPIIPFLSLCLVVRNLGLLLELTQETKKKDFTTKEQSKERKRILTKGIVYASILPSMYLSFFLQNFLIKRLFGVTYYGLGFILLDLLLILLIVYNIVLFILSYTYCNFAIKHNLKKRRIEHIVVIVPMITYITLEILAQFYNAPACLRGLS